jgi:peptide/nickel transport system permease protein
VTGFVIRRILALVPTWLGISFFAFALSTMSPGDPAELILGRQLDEPPTPAQIEEFRERTGLDDPFLVQYGRWVLDTATGDLGTSFRSGDPVFSEFASRFPATLQIAVPAFVLAMAMALGVGVLSALRRNSVADHASRVAALMGDSVPSFVLAYLLIIVFSVKWGLLPVAGRGGWEHHVLPALTLALATTAGLMRLTRSSLLDVLGEGYIRTARAMGVPERTVIARHALKNALIPVMTVAGLLFAGFVTGTVIVETVFAWPGVGNFVVDAIFARDYPVIRGFVVFTGTVFVLVNLLVDILYVQLDPRIRLGREGGRRGVC